MLLSTHPPQRYVAKEWGYFLVAMTAPLTKVCQTGRGTAHLALGHLEAASNDAEAWNTVSPSVVFGWKRLMMFVFQKTSYLAGIWQATSFDMVISFFLKGTPAVQTDLQLFQGSLKAPTWQRVMLGTSGSIGTQSRKWWVVSQKILTHDGSMGLVYLPTFGFIFYDKYVGKYPIIHGSYGL